MFPSCHWKALSGPYLEAEQTEGESDEEGSVSEESSVNTIQRLLAVRVLNYTLLNELCIYEFFIDDFNRIQTMYSSSLRPLEFWQLHVRDFLVTYTMHLLMEPPFSPDSCAILSCRPQQSS